MKDSFEYEYDDLTNKKTLFKIYLDGNLKYSVKIWLDSDFGGIDNINFAHGKIVYSGDSSTNEVFICEIDDGRNLRLKRTMGIFSNKGYHIPEEIAREIWVEVLKWIRYPEG